MYTETFVSQLLATRLESGVPFSPFEVSSIRKSGLCPGVGGSAPDTLGVWIWVWPRELFAVSIVVDCGSEVDGRNDSEGRRWARVLSG